MFLFPLYISGYVSRHYIVIIKILIAKPPKLCPIPDHYRLEHRMMSSESAYMSCKFLHLIYIRIAARIIICS